MNPIYASTTEKFKLEIFHDDSGGATSPRDYDGHFVMITWEDRYGSPDPNDWDSFNAFRKEWERSYVGRCPECGNDGTVAWKVAFNAANSWAGPSTTASPLERDGAYVDCGWCGENWEPGPGEGKGGFCLMLHRNDYDGSIATRGNLSTWERGDREPDGVIFATAKQIAEYMPYTGKQWQKVFGKSRAKVVIEQLEGEVSEYSTWAVGNVYGYVLSEAKHVHVTVTDRESGDTIEDEDEDRWEEIDACWGFITEDPDKDVPEWAGISGYTGEEQYKELIENLKYV